MSIFCIYLTFAVAEKTQHNFDIAMKGGTLMIRNGSVFFLGPGGSGKTHTLHAFLREDPPSVRQSTPCAKRTVRTIAQCKVGVEGVYFIRIQDDQYSDMLSTTAKLIQPQQSITTYPPTQSGQCGEISEITSVSALSSEYTEEDKSHATKQEHPDFIPQKKQETPQCRLSGFERELLRRMQLVPKRSEDLFDKDLIDMKDSGGQPMFHEVLPLFVKNTTFGVFTVKLNERLDSYPMVDYYSNGKPVGEPFLSPYTHLQTFRHCMRVLQSTCSLDTCPKLVFIGTHKDCEQECLDESREEKNQKLRDIIPPDLKQSVLCNYEHSDEELLFGVNVKTPENEDRKMIGHVRQKMIKELHKLPKQRIPLQYFALENAFLRLAKYQYKGVLSKDECFREAAAYHFTTESFEAALKYLHSLKLIFYYKEVLPEVVFIDAHTILDKITELVEFSLCIHSKSVHELSISIDIKEFQEFKAYGIVTLDLLSEFNSHYVPGLFMQQQLVLVLKYLRVIAEVGEGKYIVPCLLRVHEPRPLSHSVSSSITAALLFYFGPNGPKLGVYCCLLASLITEAKWELMTEDNRPVQVSRNQVQFRLPGDDPGAITITDSFTTFFHVSIDFPEDIDIGKAEQICEKICPSIRETILSMIQKTSHKLNYNNSIPAVAFPCIKHLPGDLHPATVSSSGLLTCTLRPASVCSNLTEQHQIWLGKNNRGINIVCHAY
jgi:GTPase SAR1 family protein